MNDPRHNDEIILTEVRALKELLTLRISQNEVQIDELKRTREDFNKRINLVELWQSNQLGKFSVVMVAIGIGITILTSWVTKHIQ